MGILKSIKDTILHEDRQYRRRTQQRGDSRGSSGDHDQESHQLPATKYDPNVTEDDNRRQIGFHEDAYVPPPGPPPSHTGAEANPPPYESWFSVPDSSQLPPPPSIPNEYSRANNASALSAELGQEWCAIHRIYVPAIPRSATVRQLSQQGHLNLDPQPNGFKGTVNRINARTWKVKTEKKQSDMTLTSTIPAYLAAVYNPLIQLRHPDNSGCQPRSVTVSFSVAIQSLGPNGIVAVGFVCKPYPPFRLPGWNRGSLAVHSDDGNRYVNDSFGGIDLSRPFQARDEVRITMTVSPYLSPKQPGSSLDVSVTAGGDTRTTNHLPKCATRVTFELNVQTEHFKREWDVHEERDSTRAGGESGGDGGGESGIEGLQGEADLYCAVGICGATEFTVTFEQMQ